MPPSTPCYVPVLPYKNGMDVSPVYAYDLTTCLPYIMRITLEEYMMSRSMYRIAQWLEGVWCEHIEVCIPPFALYPNEAAARLALDEVIVCRAVKHPRVAP